MKTITLTWQQVRMVKRQISAAEDGKILGHEGKITTSDGIAVEWNLGGITMRIPDAILGEKQEE